MENLCKMERHLVNTHVQSTYSIHITLESGACNAHYLFEGLRDVCFYLFLYWLCGVFLAGRRLPLVAASGATLHCGTWASRCSAFSCCGAQAPGTWASVFAGCRLSSFGPWALVALWHVESSWTRDWTLAACIVRHIPVCYTTEEVRPQSF